MTKQWVLAQAVRFAVRAKFAPKSRGIAETLRARSVAGLRV